MKHASIRTGAALVLLGLLVVVPRSLFAADWVNLNSAGTPPTPAVHVDTSAPNEGLLSGHSVCAIKTKNIALN